MTAVSDDELLPGSGAERSPRRVRTGLALLLAAVGLGTVAALAGLGTPTTDGSGSTSLRRTTFTAPVIPVPPAVALPPGRCSEDCRVSTAVPAPVRAAVDATYPGARVEQVVSHYDSREVLVDRRVVATDGDRVLRVLLTRQSPQPELVQHSTAQGHDVQRVRVSLGRTTVDVAAELPAGRTSGPASLRRLARDPRLGARG